MLRIGIIGLGDIAHKAYLPIVCELKLEIHLFTRNKDTLTEVGARYRINHLHQSLESIIQSGIRGAFVHAPTAAHYAIVETLILHGIHVYVDKPITFEYATTAKLVQLANREQVSLRVGFNRRFAPAYIKAKELSSPNMVILQKNRASQPGEIRSFIFDDFIHVVDTLLFFFPYAIDKLLVSGKKHDGLLYHVTLQLIAADGAVAIGIMNRDSGTTEEKLEIFTHERKCVVYDVAEVVMHEKRNQIHLGTDDWESTLRKRGFHNIIENFLQTLGEGYTGQADNEESLLTHKICEDVVQQLSNS